MSEEMPLPVCRDEERSILGAILEEGRAEAYDQATQLGLVPEDFHLHAHQLVYSVIAELTEGGEDPDILSVAGKLHDRGHLATVGGKAYVSDLLGGFFYDRKSFASYVKRVRNASDLRKVIAACRPTPLRLQRVLKLQDVSGIRSQPTWKEFAQPGSGRRACSSTK